MLNWMIDYILLVFFRRMRVKVPQKIRIKVD
jgi:hypothetical protein